MPDTMPDVPTEATAVLAELQVPPAVALANEIVCPSHAAVVPVILPILPADTVVVMRQPPDNV
jgi:hypothetical protein